MTYQAEEAQSDEAEGDGSVAGVGDPEDLSALVQAWEGTGSHLRVYVQTLLPRLQASGYLGDRWLEGVDREEVGAREDLGVGRPQVAAACMVPEVAVAQAVAVQGEDAGHGLQDQENP